MTINELLSLMDREAGMLTAENNHSAAAIMRAAAAKLRTQANCVDKHGHPECCPHGVKADCTACEPLARLRHR